LQSETKTSVFLYSLCTGDESAKSECDTYINGVRAGMFAQRLHMGFTLGRSKGEPEPSETLKELLMTEPFCIPESMSAEELRETVVGFLKKVKKKGDKGEMAAGFAVFLGLNGELPCKV